MECPQLPTSAASGLLQALAWLLFGFFLALGWLAANWLVSKL